MKVIKLFKFGGNVHPERNDVCKIQIIDKRYYATEIDGWYDSELNQFYYTFMAGDCCCRGYIDTLAIVSWEYN